MTNYRLAGQVSGVAAFVAAALLVTGAPAAAAGDDRASRTSDTQKVAPENDSRKYCVVTEVTGSILKTRTCKTRSEWIEETGVDPAVKRR